ncbi:hypothetical protein [Mycobacterium sp.]|jgi:hypothetical protein|uniref:hypothetical protein n=1 Tax=Mycobacterium sp. TaxID=1785 RepID=UPI002D57863F|nr:hypothetical protein [Mycobacterium sp.]HZA08561.1 hypothetical protein [Mycobacterium sp.]
MPGPDVAANNALDGVFENGQPRPWAWVDVRNDYTLGHNQLHRNERGEQDRGPWRHTMPDGTQHPGTPSHLDHGVGAAEAVAFRYVGSDGVRVDLPDILILLYEDLLERRGPNGMANLRQLASELRELPWNRQQ